MSFTRRFCVVKKPQQVSGLVNMEFSVAFSLVWRWNKWLLTPCLPSAEALCWHFHCSDCCVRADHTPGAEPPHTCWETTSHPALYANPHTGISIWKVWVEAFLIQSKALPPANRSPRLGLGLASPVFPMKQLPSVRGMNFDLCSASRLHDDKH